MMLAWTFHNMIMPFILIYAGESLHLPLTTLAGLFTIYAIAGMTTTFIGGGIADRFGRKWVIVVAFLLSAGSWLLLLRSNSMPFFVGFMILNGATTPLYRLAADAMMADLVPAPNRIDAYSIMRMGNNLGVALGPAIGGFIAAVSYSNSFIISGTGMFVCTVLVVFLFAETVPRGMDTLEQTKRPAGGYLHILKDFDFMTIVGSFTLNRISSSTLWLMLGAYLKGNFGMSERLYGFIPTTNALMVIFFQVLITRWVKRHSPGWMMALGASLYGVALLGVAVGQGFWAFWLCMVVATIGEMILVPTSTTSVAALAPEDMRGRYMSVYTLTNGVGQGVGPLLGGFLSDTFFPAATWIGGGFIGMVGAVAFMFRQLSKRGSAREKTAG